ncbi:dpr-interacting protein beta isoform X1 [Choristoneura fumiferana]|uniref:dpr-interacting protein beta isoform X1 n=2 Tax=Choristoneura fumiferana TaxID=7141 RepID=UPI003D159B79
MAAGAHSRGGRPLARLLVLAVLHVNFIALGLEPDFLYPLENVTIAQGRDAMFTCVVNNLGGYRVSGDSATARVAWIKADTKAILAIHEHVITNNARLSVTHNDYNTWTLNIRGVKREDRGQYMCQVNTDPMKMQTAWLEVVIPPDINYEETSGDMMVPEGGSAKLVCKARGFPPPKILWRREDGGDLISRGGPQGKTKVTSLEGDIVNLTKVTRSEMGAYLCIAANGVPPSVSKRIMLHVHFHPLVQVPNQLVGAPTGTDVTLQCHVEASPKAINYWTRENGEMIISNEKYQMSEINSSAYSVQMRLIIKNIHRSDLGGYKCISKNSIGDAEGNIRLYEMELPHRKSRDDEESDSELEETNDVRSSLQGSLREGGPRSQDAGFLGRPPPGAAHRVTPSSIFLISTLVYAAC